MAATARTAKSPHDGGPAVMSIAGLFLRLDGRIGRSQYWYGIVGLDVAANVSIDALLTSGRTVAVVIGVVLLLGYFWSTVCIVGKRFHDRDKSALWCLVLLIPVIGWVWVIVECGFLTADDEANRFGRTTSKAWFEARADRRRGR
jgi:uncharacterized membrane protein YhaH (DUF805 family)